jgi:hypothetical protein
VGYRTALFESADAFLISDRIHDPDCLIVDYRMTGMIGLHLVRTLTDMGQRTTHRPHLQTRDRLFWIALDPHLADVAHGGRARAAGHRRSMAPRVAPAPMDPPLEAPTGRSSADRDLTSHSDVASAPTLPSESFSRTNSVKVSRDTVFGERQAEARGGVERGPSDVSSFRRYAARRCRRGTARQPFAGPGTRNTHSFSRTDSATVNPATGLRTTGLL